MLIEPGKMGSYYLVMLQYIPEEMSAQILESIVFCIMLVMIQVYSHIYLETSLITEFNVLLTVHLDICV
jgi:hypothetical protein